MMIWVSYKLTNSNP